VLLGVLCCALYTVLACHGAVALDPLLVVALQQTFALLWALLIWPIEGLLQTSANLAAIEPHHWAGAIVSGVLYYALAFWLYIIGLRYLPASVAGLFLNLIPIFGVGGAYLFLGERLSLAQWAGAALILAAVFGIMRLQIVGPPAPQPAASPLNPPS